MVSEEKRLINAIQPKKFDAMAFKSDESSLIIPNLSGITGNQDAKNKLYTGYRSRTRWIKPFVWTLSQTTATAVANRVRMQEFEINEPTTLEGISIINFATVAGNCYVGVYGPIITEDTPEGAPLAAISADTALAGANGAQFIPFTSAVTLPTGRYYAAVVYSDGTHTYGQNSITYLYSGVWTPFYNLGGYGPFTNPCPALVGMSSTPVAMMIRSTGV